jgi:hypothetical protein
MSDVTSTGIATSGGYGKTCRKDVLRGVVVPVVPGTAGGARPVACSQAQGGERVVADQPGGGTVQEVGAGGADLPVRAGDLRLRFGPVRRAAQPGWLNLLSDPKIRLWLPSPR